MKSKILTLLSLLICLPMILWAQIGGYDPDNPDDPGTPHLKHTLTLIASPDNSCYLDRPTSRVEEGSTFYLYASPRNGFRFVAWMLSSGDTLSLAQDYLFTMPDSDLTITALLVYDPTNPPDPNVIQRSKQLTLSASPANGGSFNFRNGRVPINDIVTLYAYPNRDYEFVYWSLNDTILSNSPELDYTMPNRDVQIVAHYRYNPANPGNPGANSANPNGDILMDDFTPGQLVSAIADVLEQANMTYNDVRRITAIGSMRNYDFGIAEYFPLCHYIDLSQVSGITTVPSWAFESTAIDTILLPSSINSISNYAFASCHALSAIYCYAVMPPSVENTSFDSVPHSSVHVYVPASALALYQAHPVWSTFQLHTMEESVSNLTVSIPPSIPITELDGMKLIATNLTSHRKQYLILNGSRQYSFSNLQNNSSWKITIENQRNDIFGSIDSVHISHNDTTITMSNILLPKNVSLSIFADGVDVTSQVQVTWFSQDDLFLHRGSVLQQIRQGSDVKYQVALPKSLTFEYLSVPITPYHVGTTDNNISLALTHHDTVRISGFVKDSTTREMLSNASVNIVQTFEGKYQRSILLKTDSRGFYTTTLFKVPTSIECNAENHYGKTIVFDSSMWSSGSSTVLPMVELKNYVSGFMSLHLSYQPACEEDRTPTIQPLFSDYRNVRYSLFNRTQNRPVEDVSVNYPMLKIRDEANSGDTIDLRAISTTDAFYPVDTFLVLDSTMHGSAFINILEKGKIVATYGTTQNDHTVALLFDSEGFLITRQEYSSDQVEFDNLNNGIYTVVSMSDHDIFSHIASLQNLVRIGLVEYSDYLSNTIQVSNGRISTIYNDSIPHLSDSNSSILSTNSSFTSDECDVTVGELVTLRANIELKPLVDGFVSNPTLIIDLPPNCSFVGNSVIINNRTSQCSIEGNQLVIPLTAVNGLTKVRLCVQATSSGNLAQTAYLRYSHNDVVSLDPIGTTNISVVGFRISVPEYVATPNIPVMGTAEPLAIVSIFDADEMIGQTQANADGKWSFTYSLGNDIGDYAECSIWAKYGNSSNVEMISDTKSCLYNQSGVTVSTVTMYHHNPEVGKTYRIVFDFQNTNTNAQNYIYYIYNKRFDFTIDFTDNSPETVSNVKLWVKLGNNTWTSLNAEYDSLQNKWIAEGEFGDMYDGIIPVNVSVEYVSLAQPLLSKTLMNESASNFADITTGLDNEILNIEQSINLLFAAIEDTTIPETIVARMIDSLCLVWGIDTSTPIEYYADSAEFAAAMASLDSVLSDPYWVGMDSLMSMTATERMNYRNLMNGITIEDCTGIDTSMLVAQGYTRKLTTDSSIVFILQNDTVSVIVDLANHIRYHVVLNDRSNNDNSLAQLLYSKSLTIEYVINKLHDIQQGFNTFNDWVGFFTNEFEAFTLSAQYNSARLLAPVRKNLHNMLSFYREAKRNADAFVVWNNSYKDPIHNAISLFNVSKKVTEWRNILLKNKLVKKFNVVANINSAILDIEELIDKYYKLPTTCDGPDSAVVRDAKNELIFLGVGAVTYYIGFIGRSIVELTTAAASAAAEGPSFGASTVTLLGSLVAFFADIVVQQAYQRGFKSSLKVIDANIPSPLRCTQDDDNNDDSNNQHKGTPSLTPDAHYALDPSGYVYEGVPSNRLEGVTATCFFKEYEEMPNGDIEEHEMLWDASEFDQENPLYTDENGFYQWFVPQGLWKVVFEKMGYETAQTDWLPVPPPQLEVNVGMLQNSHPEVKMAHAYPDAVEFEFDKFMLPLLLNANNISITQNGVPIAGSIVFLNEESADTLNAPSFVSKIRFNASSAFTANQITLHVSSRVKSYANVAMQSDYIQTFTVEQEISKILCDSIVYVPYGRDMTVRVAAVPATAAAGKTLRIYSVSPEFLSVSADSAVLDPSGETSFTVHGNLPGMTSLHYSIDGYDKTAYSTVSITRNSCNPVYTSEDINVCDQFSYGDSIYHNSCTIRNVYTAASGCDSIHTIHLTVHHSVQDSIFATICNGQSFFFGQTNLTNPGVYTDTLQTSNQCDSIITLTLTVNSTSTFTDQVVACDSFEWHGTTYTASTNTPTYTEQNAAGCDSTTNLHLTIYYSQYDTIYVDTIGAYTWNDSTYTHSGEYVQHFQTVQGCDSVVTLHLTIFNSVDTAFYAESCDSYIWNGSTYTHSGDYVQHFQTAHACDSVVILHLTIYNSVDTAFYAESCNSYIWNDSTYTQSGNYVQHFQTVHGCDSVVTLHLTIYNSIIVHIDDEICQNNEYHNNGFNVSIDSTMMPGILILTNHGTATATGCDSTTTMKLTIHPLPNVVILGDTIINIGESVTLTASGAQYYVWNTGDNTASIVVTPTINTIYNVIGSTEYNCQASDSIKIYVSTGVISYQPNVVQLYPSPTNNRIEINLADEIKLQRAVIYDAIGRQVYILTTQDSQNHLSVTVDSWSNGMYFVHLFTSKGLIIKKFIKD